MTSVPATVGLVLVLVGVSALLPLAFRTLAAAWRKRRRTRELAVLAAAARMSVVRQRRHIEMEVAEFAAQISAWNQNGGQQ